VLRPRFLQFFRTGRDSVVASTIPSE